MPPKPQPKKHRKPLTPLQRKQQKRKYELIHKATVKSQYYKTLNKEKDADDTPDYVKDIFGAPERTIDNNGNVVELKKEEVEEEEEEEFDLDQESSEEEEEEEGEEKQRLNKRQKRIEAMSKLPKPNPFKSQLDERERRKKESEEEKKERQKKIKEENEARKKYFKDRKEERSKMLAKTKRGQPKMASQMDVLLAKIQKNMD
ncbi:hypothetical protein BD770DRAFT_411139 [Pilaira anomala]|nr:hypothetical protein BD770DRAFT_411139 [Pilaira anomala]